MGEPRIMIAVDEARLDAIMSELAALRREIAGVRMAPAPEWLPLPDYAEKVGRTTKTVRNWVRDGLVESKRDGNVLMIRA